MQRFRTRGALLQRTICGTKIWETCSFPTWFTGPPTNCAMHGLYEEMTDYVIPKFDRLSAQGEVFFNPMRQKRWISYEPAGHAALLEVKGTLSCSGVIHHPMYSGTGTNVDMVYCNLRGLPTNGFPYPLALLSDSRLAEMRDECSTRVLSERGRGNSSSNLFETLAEGRKSLKMIPDICKNITSLIGKAEKRVKASTALRKKVKTAADLYLTYRYGIRPLLMDFENIVGGMKKGIGLKRQTTRSFLSESTRKVEVLHTTGIGAQEILVQTDDTINVRAMSLDEYRADLASNTGFAGKNLVTVTWDLVPYSFVVDWFVNVNDFFGAYVPSPNYKQLGGCIVSERIRQHTVSSYGNIPDATFNILSPDVGSFETFYIEKIRTGGLLAPKLLIKGNFRLDEVTRAADAVSLLIQRMKIPPR